MKKKSAKPLIVALDFPNRKSTLQLIEQLDPALCRVKVGKELFTACGPELVHEIQRQGFEVFLDLKFHDIPNTVAGAVRAAADLGVWMVNVHASGGRAMLEAAREALVSNGSRERPLLIAVTVLTSLGQSDLLEVGIADAPDVQVRRLATLARDCGLDGVVCSAAETAMLRAALPDDFCLVTPGIRRPEDQVQDQKRVVGPAQALRNGSDFLVVGRPITGSASPAEALALFCAATGDS